MSRPSARDIAGIEQEAKASYSKATTAELNKDWNTAFQLYITAAEKYLHVTRITSDERLRTSCNSNASKALGRAEKIRGYKKNLAPYTTNPFLEQQQNYVLTKSACVNALRLPLWDDPLPEQDSTRVYQDPDGQPELSKEQRKHTPTWLSPASVLPNASMTSPNLLPQDIIQNIVTDCSLCASISVCIDHHRRFGSRLALSSLFPQDQDEMLCLAKNARYSLRFQINGAYRRITIDDKLPFDVAGRLLCMTTRGAIYLWPSLVEKAYMKLMGGYEFPGSNSSIDLHLMIGWIPEYIEIKSPTFERDNAWGRILQGFHSGRCLFTVGTDEQIDLVWQGEKLLPVHSYAVIDMQDSNDQRTLALLDFWSQPQSVNGQRQSRILHFSWEELCDVFHGLYLSWDPKIFHQSLDFHGMWNPNNLEKDDPNCRDQHVRVKVKVASESVTGIQEVWILLTRHIVNSRSRSESIALCVQAEEGQLQPEKRIRKETYTNSPHILFRHSVSPSTESLSIYASYDGLAQEVGFTITVYSPSNYLVHWDKDIPEAPYTMKIDGTLTQKSAGGNCTYPSFMLNPQYHLNIQAKPTSLACRGSKEPRGARIKCWFQGPAEVPLNTTVVWSHGERVIELAKRDLVATSGAYSYGLSRLVKDLPVGDYTVILSAFEPVHLGHFRFRIECTNQFDLKPIPQEGAGMYCKVVHGEWDAMCAMGGPRFGQYFNNPVFILELSSDSQVKIRLQLVTYIATTSLNVTLFSVSRERSFGSSLATSGPYSDAISGVAVSKVSLAAGKYFLIPSTFSPNTYASFRVIVYSTTPEVTVSRRLKAE